MSDASRVKGGSEEMQMAQYRAQLERENDAALREIKSKSAEEIQRTIDEKELMLGSMRNAYDLKISREAEILEEELTKMRQSQMNRIDLERKNAEAEVDKIKMNNEQRIAHYRKNSEIQIDEVRKETERSTNNLNDKYKKEAARIAAYEGQLKEKA
ncbi:MAG: hypothetical protein KA715_11705 [Xanthomonadaceae bacterium]|nr:hypothetical protein [Xanthomonadaceae bacterium]